MTPAERQYDLDLVRALRQQAAWIEPRIGKLAVLMRQAADRLETVSLEAASALTRYRANGTAEPPYDYGEASDPREPATAGYTYTDRLAPNLYDKPDPPSGALPSMAPTGGPDLPGYMENRSKNSPPAASPDQPARKRRNPRS